MTLQRSFGYLVGVALVALGWPHPALGQAPGPVLIPEPAVHLVVAEDGSEHQLFVALPVAYPAEPEARFPVLYLLDGNTMFAMMTQTYGYMEVFGALEPAIIVGVGYPVDTWDEVLVRRARDYTPTRNAETERWMRDWLGRDDVVTGAADAFLSTLITRVIPLVDETYRTNETRVLGGFSYGGLFAAHALLTAPQAFSGYLIGSPSLTWDDGVLFTLEAAFAERRRSLPARVFLSSGALEASTADAVTRLAEVFAERNYDGLELTAQIFTDETHLSVIPATLSRGLRVLFRATEP